MPITALLLALNLRQAPVKLAHTYTKDQSVTYALQLDVASQGLQAGGDITITTLDDQSNHKVDAPKFSITQGGQTTTESFSIAKVALNAHGLAPSYDFQSGGAAFAMVTVCGYAPGKEVAKGAEFKVGEKGTNYAVNGSGKVTDISGEPGKGTATIDYKLTIHADQGGDANLVTKSVFDVATGQLVSSQGTIGMQGNQAKLTVKKK